MCQVNDFLDLAPCFDKNFAYIVYGCPHSIVPKIDYLVTLGITLWKFKSPIYSESTTYFVNFGCNFCFSHENITQTLRTAQSLLFECVIFYFSSVSNLSFSCLYLYIDLDSARSKNIFMHKSPNFNLY